MNILKSIMIIVLVLFIFSTVKAEKLAVLPDLLKPTALAIDEDRFYVSEEASILIYSLKDFKLIKRFGQRGEGPSEFPTLPGVPVSVTIDQGMLMINSANRISYFTKEGEFVRFIKSKGGSLLSLGYQPVNGHFVGLGITQEDGIIYNLVNLFDGDLNKIKSIAKIKRAAQQSGPIKIFSDTTAFQALKDRIYIVKGDEFAIDVLNVKGEPVHSITRDYKRIRFTEEYENELIEAIKAGPQGEAQYEALKSRIEFPRHFPAIASIFVADDLLHVITWKHEKNQFELFIYDHTGKLARETTLTFVLQGALTPFPTAFKNRKIYQLIENEDEDWELHASELK